jgi:transcription antitermination factor NusG
MSVPSCSGQPQWAVCQALSSRVHRVRPEIEKIDRGTFVPTFARVWASDGKLSARERQLFPGYLFFVCGPEDWGAVAGVDGVYRVLTNDGSDGKRRASLVPEADMQRLVIGHATGAFNEIDLRGLERPSSKTTRRRKRTRSRPSKRARQVARAEAA